MKICFIADARSPISQGWIGAAIERGHDVSVLSSYPFAESERLGDPCIPCDIGFSKAKEHLRQRSRGRRTSGIRFPTRLEGLGREARAWIAPFDVQRRAGAVHAHIRRIQPDLLHALRLPYEGLAAGAALRTDKTIPLVVSIWGNDLTLFASRYPPIGWYTRRVLRRANGLHTDCQRDAELATEWGFDRSKPTLVAPGNGGIRPLFHRGAPAASDARAALGIPSDAPIVLHPRGVRSYVRNDTFFAALPSVLRTIPQTVVVLVGMQGHTSVEQWTHAPGIRESLRVLGQVEPSAMADLFRMSRVFVSVTDHDGTPNTLLEGMASGSLPIAGDIPSINEWIVDGENGLLCEPSDPGGLATAIVRGLQDVGLRTRAAARNRILVHPVTRASIGALIDSFYSDVFSAGRVAQ